MSYPQQQASETSDEAQVRRRLAEAVDGYEVEHGIVRSLGKFQGEPVATLYYYGAYLDGGADHERGPAVGFNVTPAERRVLGLGRRRVFWFYERSDGFVCAC